MSDIPLAMTAVENAEEPKLTPHQERLATIKILRHNVDVAYTALKKAGEDADYQRLRQRIDKADMQGLRSIMPEANALPAFQEVQRLRHEWKMASDKLVAFCGDTYNGVILHDGDEVQS